MIRLLHLLSLATAFSFLIGIGPVSFLIGLIIAYLLLRYVPQLPDPKRRHIIAPTPRQMFFFSRNVFLFVADFLKDLTISNVVIAWDVWSPGHTYRPMLLEVPVHDLSDFETVLIATRITLTPGTLTSDISADGKTLIVHVMYPSGESHPTELRRPIDILRKDLV